MAELAERVPLRRYCVIPQSIQKRMNQHPLCKILYLTEIGYEAETAFRPFKKQAVGNHFFLLVYVASGEGWYSVRGKTFMLKRMTTLSCRMSLRASWVLRPKIHGASIGLISQGRSRRAL